MSYTPREKKWGKPPALKPPESVQLNEAELIKEMGKCSIVQFSILLTSEEQLKSVLKELEVKTDVLSVGFCHKVQTINPVEEGDIKKYFLYFIVTTESQNLKSMLTLLSDYAAECMENPDRLTSIGAQHHVLSNKHQTEKSKFLERAQLSDYLLEKVMSNNLRNVALRCRIEKIESSVEAIADDLRINKVMNFEYSQIHRLPQLLWNLCESLGKTDIVEELAGYTAHTIQ